MDCELHQKNILDLLLELFVSVSASAELRFADFFLGPIHIEFIEIEKRKYSPQNVKSSRFDKLCLLDFVIRPEAESKFDD